MCVTRSVFGCAHERNGDACKARASIKRIIADAYELAIISENYARKTGAAIERPFADALQLAIFAEGNARKTGAAIERPLVDACHARRNFDARKTGAAIECIIADACAGCNDHRFQAGRNVRSMITIA